MRRLALVLAAVVTIPIVARADVIGYASSVDGNLYRINLTTVTATVVGKTNSVSSFQGLAFNSAGVLYGTDDVGNLSTLSTATGQATRIGNTGLGNVTGLAFSGDRLVGINLAISTSLYAINTDTASATILSNITPNVRAVQALTLETASSGYLLGSSPSGFGLYSVTTSGVTEFIGATNLPTLSFALAAGPNGVLYATDFVGNAYTVSKTTGAYTRIGNLGNLGSGTFTDLAISPLESTAVPEPSSLALFAVGLSSVVATRTLRTRKTHNRNLD